MTILITGSAGHLGEALMRTLRAGSQDSRGIDIAPSPFHRPHRFHHGPSLRARLHARRAHCVIVLKTSCFFPEEDDDATVRSLYSPHNAQANELLHRRVDIEDVVDAHLLAARQAPAIGFGRYIVSATTPFTQEDLPMHEGRDFRSQPARDVGSKGYHGEVFDEGPYPAA
ncbi:hypothetical protein [Variovorax sp.]|uniref:hypothetical protein n=1 Tax=Variovorax sp. TaxID=1871043 RepID=UPI003BAAD25F